MMPPHTPEPNTPRAARDAVTSHAMAAVEDMERYVRPAKRRGRDRARGNSKIACGGCSSSTAACTHPDRSSPCRSRRRQGRARQPTTQPSSRKSPRRLSRAPRTPRQPRGGQWSHAREHKTRRRPALRRVGGSTHRGSHPGPFPGGGSCTGPGALVRRPARAASSDRATAHAPQQNDIVALVRRSLHSITGSPCCLPATIDVHCGDRLRRGLVQSLSLRVQILEDPDARDRREARA